MSWSVVEYYRRFRESRCHCHQFTIPTFQRISLPLSSVYKTDVSGNHAATVISLQNQRFRESRCHCHQFTKPTFQIISLPLSSVYKTDVSENLSATLISLQYRRFRESRRHCTSLQNRRFTESRYHCHQFTILEISEIPTLIIIG